jgi:hypothetical protein
VIEDDRERLMIRNILEIVMSMARNEADLRKWAADHKEIVSQHLSDADKKYLTANFIHMLKEFEERKQDDNTV